jgi:DNA replication and repair protein RecF
MYIQSLHLTNWRNHSGAGFSFDQEANIIIGSNAIGKTNILEAIIFLALTKSFRIKQDRLLINHGQDFAKVSGKFANSNDHHLVEIRLIGRETKTKKEIYHQGLSVRAIDLIGQIPLVYFSPEDIEHFFSSPARRRRWLDIAISLTDFQYSYNSAVYRKVINNRNHLLKKISHHDASENELDFWDNKWLELSQKIIEARRNFIKKLSPTAGDNFGHLFKSENKLSIEYQQTFAKDNLPEGLSNLLHINRRREINYGNTIIGPHREDIIINLDGKKIVEVGSRGQMRLALLALKMSEAIYLEQQKSDSPIIILDDIFSELDQTNQQHVFDFITTHQTIITATDLESLPKHFQSAHIINL